MIKPHLVAPSVLAANFGNLEAEMNMINSSNADWLHVDIMDGNFVPNISFGQEIVDTIHKLCKKPLDVHLMVANPDKYADEFIDKGASSLTFHIEANVHAHRLLHHIRSRGVKAGIAINPQTPVSCLSDILEDIDLVCIMSVNPGFGGQKFIYRALQKIRELRTMMEERNIEAHIEVDGGIGLHNAEEVLKSGADVLIAGNAVFRDKSPLQVIQQLKDLNPIRSF
jgi:ribulose-phosphate 3-epimerase